jgi:hypothetical protein
MTEIWEIVPIKSNYTREYYATEKYNTLYLFGFAAFLMTGVVILGVYHGG